MQCSNDKCENERAKGSIKCREHTDYYYAGDVWHIGVTDIDADYKGRPEFPSGCIHETTIAYHYDDGSSSRELDFEKELDEEEVQGCDNRTWNGELYCPEHGGSDT